MAVLYGIDVSKWQGNINWSKVKESGKVDYVIIKAGHGKVASQKDPKFEVNYSECKAKGIPCGCYWYSYATSVLDAEKEAEACLSVLKGKKFEYPIYFDIEERKQFNLGKNVVSNIVDAFCSKLEKAGYFVGIYSSKSHLESYMTPEVRSKYTVWVAHYGVQKTNYSGDYDMWQKSPKGSIVGISGDVDLDECYKDFPSIIKTVGKNGYEPVKIETPANEYSFDETKTEPTENPPMPTLPEEPKTKKVRIICSALYKRSGPSVKYGPMGVAYKNEIYEISEEKNGWGNIKDTNLWMRLRSDYVKYL